MAFVPVTLPTQTLLETTYVSDMRLYVNTNTGIFKDKIETLINNLKIDLTANTVGVDSDSTLVPLTNLKTKTLTIQNGNLYFKNVAGTSNLITFEIVTSGNTSIGKITTGSLTVNNTLIAQTLNTTGDTTSAGDVTVNGVTTAAGGLTIEQGFANSFEALEIEMEAYSPANNRARAEITLSSTSSSLIYLDLDATNFMDGANLDNTLIGDGIDIILLNDTNSPISAGQNFTIVVRKVFYYNVSVPTTLDWYAFSDAEAIPAIRIIAEDFAVNDQDAVGEDQATLAAKWVVGLSNYVLRSSVTLMNIGQVKNQTADPDTWLTGQSRLLITGHANAVFNTATYPVVI